MDIEKNKTKFMAIGAIFIACLTAVFVYTFFAVLLLGKTRVWNSVQDGFNFLMSPIGMALAVLGFAILVVFFIVDFKLRKKIKTPQKRSYIRKKKRATKRVNVRR